MSAEDILYRMDPRKIHIISGDIAPGYWELHGSTLSASPQLLKPAQSNKQQAIKLDRNIAKLDLKEIADSNPTANLVGIGVGALAGLRLFGPLGAIGGAVAGQIVMGNRHELTAEVLLQDGRQFTAQMDKNIFNRLKLIAERELLDKTNS